jgi:hypothetical protein
VQIVYGPYGRATLTQYILVFFSGVLLVVYFTICSRLNRHRAAAVVTYCSSQSTGLRWDWHGAFRRPR